jgi:tetratricopeptide (TPR) repeat protein
MFYQKHGKFDQALKTYAHITEQNPAHAQSFFNQGYIYLTEFLNYKKAVEMFQKAIEADPNYTEAVYNLGRTYEAMGDTLKAKEKYREALKLTTNYPLAIEGLNRLEE